MYINDIHILIYVSAILLGMVVGDFIKYVINQFCKNRKILSNDFFLDLIEFKPAYLQMFLTSTLYVVVLYTLGIKDTLVANLDLIKFFVLIPLLEIAFFVDVKKQIIPNRLTMTIFETGVVFVFLYGLSDITITYDYIYGMLAGAGIFLGIALIGGLMYGKDAIGFGDVKLVAALGLYFGVYNIINLTLISFLIGALVSLILIVIKKKTTNEYIAFGPFIVIAAFLIVIIPSNILKTTLMNIFTLGVNSR